MAGRAEQSDWELDGVTTALESALTLDTYVADPFIAGPSTVKGANIYSYVPDTVTTVVVLCPDQ